MTAHFAPSNVTREEIYRLADSVLAGDISAAELQQFEQIITENPEACRWYVEFIADAYHLRTSARLRTPTITDCLLLDENVSENKHENPPIIITTDDVYSVKGFSPLSWSMAYTVSAVILCVALFIASLIYLPEPTKQFAQSGDNDNAKTAAATKGQSDQKRPASADQAMRFVGRITGMVDCEFSDENTVAVAGASVPLGRKYALARGLMEITYNSGAKVILQGPCQYEVNDPAGGFLALGKLTAKIEKKEGGSGQGSVASGQKSVDSGRKLVDSDKWSVARQSVEPQNLKNSEAGSKSEESDPQPQIKKSLFTVRTPSAIITDLGTEFGVEVDSNGITSALVLSGRVQLATIGSNTGSENKTVLEVGRYAKVDSNNLLTVNSIDFKEYAKRFVQKLPDRVSISENYARLVLSLNPAVYYRMEKPTGDTSQSLVIDSAAGKHHGTLFFDKAFYCPPYVPGRFGDALFFRGPAVKDYIIVPDYPKAKHNKLSASAWVFAISRPEWASIIKNWNGPKDRGQFHFGLTNTSGDLSIYILDNKQMEICAREGVTKLFPTYQWQHVAFVADGTRVRLYRNGSEVASQPYKDLVYPNNNIAALGIGCKTDASGTLPDESAPGFWAGMIDEVAIFNHALSEAEIQKLWQGY